MNRPLETVDASAFDPECVEKTMKEIQGVVSVTLIGRSRRSERGAGVVEWLGISALSIGMLVVLFTAMEALGLDVVAQIRASLGL
jgi:hypothetical protein